MSLVSELPDKNVLRKPRTGQLTICTWRSRPESARSRNVSKEEEHPEERVANDAKSALLLSGVAVVQQARAQIESEAEEAYEASPRN